MIFIGYCVSLVSIQVKDNNIKCQSISKEIS